MVDDNNDDSNFASPSSDQSPVNPMSADFEESDSDFGDSQASGSQSSGSQSSGSLRPLGVTVMMVLCIVGGLVGLSNGCMSGAGLVFNQVASDMLVGDPDSANGRMQAEMMRTNQRFMIPNILVMVLGLAVSGGLLAGGLGLLRVKPWALTVLRRSFIACIVYELVRIVLFAVMQVQNGPAMERFYEDFAAESNAPDMSEMMNAMIWVGFAVWGVWIVTKIGVIIWGYVYAGTDTAKDYVGKSASETL
jgi:hypothetical protein